MIVAPVDAVGALGPVLRTQAATAGGSPATFGRMLLDGVNQVDRQLVQADSMVAAFAVDGSTPIHQVTIALEQARMSLELMMQVRTHLVDGYHELLRMQL